MRCGRGCARCRRITRAAAALAERVRASASLLTADPATGAFLASELAGLRASPLGRWLRPAAAGEDQISLTAVLRDRAVALFSLGQPRPGRAAQMIANLAALDPDRGVR